MQYDDQPAFPSVAVSSCVAGPAAAMRTSHVLGNLLQRLPDEAVDFAWVVDSLGERSVGLILILLGFIACVPGMSAFAALPIAALACQMIVARTEMRYPRSLTRATIERRRFGSVLRFAIPPLSFLERYVHPRWSVVLGSPDRLIGSAILLLDFFLFLPVPLSNLAPAMTIALLAFAYLEHDGLLACVALAATCLLVALAGTLAWHALIFPA